MKNDLSFKLLVALILSGLVLACANATAPSTPERNSLQASSSPTSPTLPPAHTTAKS